jgi:hypothetical protein
LRGLSQALQLSSRGLSLGELSGQVMRIERLIWIPAVLGAGRNLSA